MKSQYFVLAAAITAMLVAVTALATTDSVFAYDKSQATAQTNLCGNGELPLNVGCQNTGSQIQGDENVVALSARQTFPSGEEEPPTCEECFAPILDAGFPTEDLVIKLAVQLDFKEPSTTGEAVEVICEGLGSGEITMSDVSAAVAVVFVDTSEIPNAEELGDSLIECLSLIFGGGG
jgi:hypothetical protein